MLAFAELSAVSIELDETDKELEDAAHVANPASAASRLLEEFEKLFEVVMVVVIDEFITLSCASMLLDELESAGMPPLPATSDVIAASTLLELLERVFELVCVVAIEASVVLELFDN
jgi:hypothetical protein